MGIFSSDSHIFTPHGRTHFKLQESPSYIYHLMGVNTLDLQRATSNCFTERRKNFWNEFFPIGTNIKRNNVKPKKEVADLEFGAFKNYFQTVVDISFSFYQ